MFVEEYNSSAIEKIINNFIGYSQHHGHLLQKYNDSFYLNYFDRLKIDEAVKKVDSHQKQLGIPQFVRLLLSIIKHSQQQTLYLTISLVRLFKKIKQDTTNEKGVKFADFTNFLCNKISQADPDLIVPMKQIPMEKVIPDVSKIRDIDINPPPILNKIQIQRPKIIRNNNKRDRKLDEKKPVAKFIYSPSLNSIIALGVLSSSISLYEPNQLKKTYKIVPSACKIMSKDVAILSFAYCERQKRIGCIINNIGITFWQASDNFTTQKILGSSKSDHDPKSCGDKIYFFSLFNEWVTTDKDTIYFWDIKEQTVSRKIKRQNIASINDICQIKHMRCLLVGYTKEKSSNQKILVLYHGQKQVSKLNLDNSGCHTLLYNESTQLVVLIGYSILATVIQIDVKTFDINIVTQLKAHSSILTTICNIPNTAMIITGDDLGYVKLWDLNYMRCLQGQKLAKKLHQLQCHKNKLLFSDSRINVIQMQHSGKPNIDQTKLGHSQQEIYGIYQFFRKQEQTLWIITRKQARQFNLKDGRQTNIFVLCNSQEQISAAAELFNGFVVGTSKGELSKYTLDGNRKWKILAHQSQINIIKVDFQNHLIATVGSDNNAIIWSQKSILDKDNNIRKKIVFKNKDINILELSPYANLIVIGSNNDQVLQLWNYDTLKLIKTIQMGGFISTVKIIPDKSLIIVATITGELALISFYRKQGKLKNQCVYLLKLQNIRSLNENDKNINYKKTYFSMIDYCQDKNILMMGTPIGKVYSFHIRGWITNENFRRQYEPSPAIRRYTKQVYQNQILRNKYVECSINQIIYKRTLELPLLWNKNIHKGNLIGINILKMEKKYLSSLCLDGYCKLIELKKQQGQIVGSIKLNYPLPLIWNLEVQDYCDLKSQIHQALAIIDSILKNYGYDLSINQKMNLNIMAFLQQLCDASYQVKKNKLHPQVMGNQFTHFDINGQEPDKPMSLKSLQAYKRLQIIKKQNEQNFVEQKHIINCDYETTTIEKQAIRQYLSPNYLPKLLNRNCDDKNSESFSNKLIKRLQNGLNQRQTKRSKNFENNQRQNRNNSSIIKPSQNSVLTNKSLLNASMEIIKQKSVRQILGQINTKLIDYKKNKSKIIKGYS